MVEVLLSRERVLDKIRALSQSKQTFSIDDLVEETRLSRSTVIRSLHDLKSGGYIAIEKGKGRAVSRYEMINAEHI